MPFVRPSLTELIARGETDIASRLGTGPLLKRSFLGVVARVLGGLAHLLYGYLDWVVRQLMASTADTEWLEIHASELGLQREAASFAEGDIAFTGTNGIVIPEGARVQRSDGVQFDTTAEGTIASGIAVVAVTAVVAGASGNTASALLLTLVSPIAGVNATATAGEVDGGADTEDDESLRARVLARKRQPPHGGADFDYVTWAKEVAGVTRAWVYPSYLGAGTVGVAFVSDDDPDGPIPDSGLVDDVQAYIDARRPVTAAVTVFAPDPDELDLTIHISPDTSAVREAVQAELIDLLRRDAEPGGTILISRIREAVSIAAGESDNVISSPTANVTSSTGVLTVFGEITWV